jgi:hypothetical protein
MQRSRSRRRRHRDRIARRGGDAEEETVAQETFASGRRVDTLPAPTRTARRPRGARIVVEALSSDTHLELKALQGQPALLELLELLTQQSRTQLRPWHDEDELHQVSRDDLDAIKMLYRHLLVGDEYPRFAREGGLSIPD